jgi:ribosome-associated protein
MSVFSQQFGNFAVSKKAYLYSMDKKEERTELKLWLDIIVDAAQDKKAKKIATIDLNNIPGAVCSWFVVAEGNTPTQVSAIADQVCRQMRTRAQQHERATAGMQQARWVGIDYGDIIVHIFLPELRSFYDLETLWADADITYIPDLD